MRKTILYKNSEIRRVVGFIKLDTSNYTINFRLLKSCYKHRKNIKKMYNEISKVLEKYYIVEDCDKKTKNHYQKSYIKSLKKQKVRN